MENYDNENIYVLRGRSDDCMKTATTILPFYLYSELLFDALFLFSCLLCSMAIPEIIYIDIPFWIRGADAKNGFFVPLLIHCYSK